MSKGYWIGDAIATEMSRTTDALIGARQAKEDLEWTKKMVASLEQAKQWNAGNIAEKIALRVALGKIQPDHPLLVNKALQEKIQEAGMRARTLTGDWDAVREAGESFKY